MKFKYLAILSLGAVAFAACSDDDANYNTNKDVTVELAQSSIRVSEDQLSNTAYNYIPVTVKGETNGPVRVTIEVAPYGSDPAEADKNYVFTSYSINIPAGETTGQFQYYPKGNDVINPDLSFEVKIVNVEGASVGANNSTVVTLVDNEGLIPIYYPGIAGAWNGVFESESDGPLPLNVTIQTVAEGQDGYGTKVHFLNFPDAGMQCDGKFSIDGVAQEIYVAVSSGQLLGQMSHPTYGVGNILLYPVSGNSYTTAAYDFILKFNFDLKSGELVVDPEWNMGILVSFQAGMMMYDTATAITFNR